MPRVIVKINEYYLDWSSIVDAPVTFGMNREEFETYHRDEYGRQGHQNFEARMKRAEETGSSYHLSATAAEVVDFNHAGPDGSELTFDEIYLAYCLQKPIRGGWIVPICTEDEAGGQMTRELTEDEVRQQYLVLVWSYIDYWNNLPDKTCKERLEGLAFSMLVILDGDTALPGFIVAPRPHPDDKEYNQNRCANWFPDNRDAIVKCDIAGTLHEMFRAAGEDNHEK